jgi:hypothetical protein
MANSMTNDDLQLAVWELYKDVHGVRPRHLTQEEWDDRSFLTGMYDELVSLAEEKEFDFY